jgi:hypothetical protein
LHGLHACLDKNACVDTLANIKSINILELICYDYSSSVRFSIFCWLSMFLDIQNSRFYTFTLLPCQIIWPTLQFLKNWNNTLFHTHCFLLYRKCIDSIYWSMYCFVLRTVWIFTLIIMLRLLHCHLVQAHFCHWMKFI